MDCRKGKKASMSPPGADHLPRELDFSKLVFVGRGLFAGRVKAGGRQVRLAADVAKAFPTERSVNDALRLLMNAAKSATK